MQGLFASGSSTQRGVRAQGQYDPAVWQGSGTLPHGCRPSADPRCARHAGMPKALPPQTGGTRACAGAGRALPRACLCFPQGLPGTAPWGRLRFPRGRQGHALKPLCFPRDRQGPSQGPSTFSQGPPGTAMNDLDLQNPKSTVPGGPWENVGGPWDGPWRSVGKHTVFSACLWRSLGKTKVFCAWPAMLQHVCQGMVYTGSWVLATRRLRPAYGFWAKHRHYSNRCFSPSHRLRT